MSCKTRCFKNTRRSKVGNCQNGSRVLHGIYLYCGITIVVRCWYGTQYYQVQAPSDFSRSVILYIPPPTTEAAPSLRYPNIHYNNTSCVRCSYDNHCWRRFMEILAGGFFFCPNARFRIPLRVNERSFFKFLGSGGFVACLRACNTVIVGFVKCTRFSFNIKKKNK